VGKLTLLTVAHEWGLKRPQKHHVGQPGIPSPERGGLAPPSGHELRSSRTSGRPIATGRAQRGRPIEAVSRGLDGSAIAFNPFGERAHRVESVGGGSVPIDVGRA
jgi:hypothetical protein